MSLNTSKKILKIFGVIDIICGIFLIILGFVVIMLHSGPDIYS